ncbi:ABC transporter ATP-binding protein [Tomitella biformata]|uniref:ABC transporter ATP-binding protein n=1 Tax=Tomitella biformata TaxID=630403 RepID=UPI000464A52F|nr:ABC transporter ATP-binding protein [Tomitella biformata]
MSLSAHAITWARSAKTILDCVTIGARAGETIGLLGPNGSGKSSLIRLLSGLTTPDSGQVLLDGEDLRTLRRRDIARRVATVDQHSHTEVDIPVLDIVRLGRTPHRTLFAADPGADEAAIDAALAATGLADMRRRLWHTLSGGERQRAQIARALAQQPEVLLLDEPTNHLDIQHQLDILTLVAELPMTNVIALHDLNLAAMFCDRVVVLAHGRVVAAGTPVDVITAELVWEVYRVQANVTIAPEDGYPTVTYRRRRAQPVRLSG